MTRRPVGVTILAVLAIIVGVVQLLSSLSLFGLSLGALTLPFSIPGFELSALAETFGIVGGIVLMVLAALYIVFGVGALQLKSWAWTLGVVLFGLSLVAALITLFAEFTISALISAIVIAGILAYMFTPSVRTVFGHEHYFRTTHGTPSMHV